MTQHPASLNGARTFVLRALAIVWFAELALWGLQPLSEIWSRFWGLVSPGDPQLAAGLYLAHAVEACAKGALGVLAVYALRSGTPFVRSALFVPMALVPPLNVAFQFRAQGFPLVPTLIGATLSVILWETFFLLKDHEPGRSSDVVIPSSLSPSDVWQSVWFAANAFVLTVAAALFLFAPDAGLRLAFPCLPLPATPSVPSGLTLTGMAIGTHLAAVATATWIATVYSRTNTTVRQAVAVANTLHAALLCALPLPQLASEADRSCATSSLLMFAIPLLAGWLVYAALMHRTVLAARARLTRPAGH